MRIRLMILLCCMSVLACVHAAPPSYRLGPDDVVSVTVLRHPEFSGEFLVTPDGWVAVPVIGKTMVAGKTIDEFAAVVNKGLKNRLRHPEVTVSLKTPRMQRIYVLGAVVKPGILEYKAGWHVTEALAAAGGLLDNGLQADISVMHADGTTTAIDLSAMLQDGKATAASQLFPDDVVIVQKRYSRIAVLGFVNKPGYYDLQNGQPMHLSEAIGMAGGVESKRGQLKEVAVLRTQDGKQQRIVVNLEAFLRQADVKQNPELLAGDVIYIPETRKPDWSSIFQIISSIGITGSLLK